MFKPGQRPLDSCKPPSLIIWRKHDIVFSINEAQCYKRDSPDAQVNIINGGHKALETNFDEVLTLVERFLAGIRR